MKKALAIAAFAAIPVLSFAVAPTYSKSSNPVAAKKPADKPPSDDDFDAVRESRAALMKNVAWMYVRAALLLRSDNKILNDLGDAKMKDAMRFMEIANKSPVTAKQAKGYVEALDAATELSRESCEHAMRRVTLESSSRALKPKTYADLKDERTKCIKFAGIIRTCGVLMLLRDENDALGKSYVRIADSAIDIATHNVETQSTAECLLESLRDSNKSFEVRAKSCLEKMMQLK